MAFGLISHIFIRFVFITKKICTFALIQKQITMKPNATANSHNTLSSGTLIRGDVFAEEDIRVDAQVDGNIECKGKVVVGPGGIVNGFIKCKSAELMGSVTGDLFVDGRLTLKNEVTYSGDITARALEVEPGAIFNGACKMVADENTQIG